ncbi:hypothetical protein LSAT2_008753 [Lamellibrachia satsuma]|nr:hypothetical protein LSAT2_008753 [Lamellibrachia satsuma]
MNFTGKTKWLHAVIVEQTGLLSFRVRLDDGRVLRRHVDHVRSHRVNDEKEAISVPEKKVRPRLISKLPPELPIELPHELPVELPPEMQEPVQADPPEWRHLLDVFNANTLPDKCLQWHRLLDVFNASTLPDKWFCYLNTDPAYNCCEIDEEPEEELTQSTYKKIKKKVLPPE